MLITLDGNREKVTAAKEALKTFGDASRVERAAKRKAISEKEIASGTADFTMLRAVEGDFIDLAIHKDSFADDLAIDTDLDVETIPIWKARYAPLTGITTGSAFGGGLATYYVTQDSYAQLTPFFIDTEEVRVPRMALTQDPDKLGQRDAALLRQAETLRLKRDTYVVDIVLGQPLGTDIATAVVNYAGGSNPYTGKTVYVADTGVQSGTYETTNIINISTEAGLTNRFFEEVINQMILSRRQLRTIHIPVAGLPWRKLVRSAATVISLSGYTPGASVNPDLAAVPASQFEKVWNMDMSQALTSGIVMEIFGHTFRLKANNVLPQGYAIVTTDQPAAQVFNIKQMSVSTDISDPKDAYFVGHYEKRQLALAAPDPWIRNFAVVNFGSTANL